MDQENQYDEFGNYIGAVDEDDEMDEDASEEDEAPEPDDDDDDKDDDDDNHGEPSGAVEGASGAVIQVDTTEALPYAVECHEEDTQRIDQPIIEPIKVKNFEMPGRRRGAAEVDREKEFTKGLMGKQELIRNIALVGHLHHGKTSFMDYLMGTEGRHCDNRIDEHERGMSIKCHPITMVLPTSRGKSYLLNIADTPGHVNFVDEAAAALRLVDGVCIVVDVVEGVMVNTEKLIKHAISERLKLCLVVNKMDRLILELKLPPDDAYIKLRHTIEEVNNVIASCPHEGPLQKLSPELGNVVFASSLSSWCFSLSSYAAIYASCYPRGTIDPVAFGKRLWGDIYYNEESNTFSSKRGKTPDGEEQSRTFVHFLLTPLYKLYSLVVGEEPKGLEAQLSELGVRLRREQFNWDVLPFMKAVTSQFFSGPAGFVDMVVEHLLDPIAAATAKVEHCYTGEMDDDVALDMCECDADKSLVVYTTKLFHTADATNFLAWGRVMSGTLKYNSCVKVLGEAYSIEDEEDMCIKDVSNLYIPHSRERIPIEEVPAGNWVLIDGIEQPVIKTATVVGADVPECSILRPLTFPTQSVVKIAVEPLQPAELPKLVNGIRNINKTYPLAVTRAEESGEHIIMGTGEMYMDSIMHDLRRMYADIEVKVADPVVSFSETVVETSSIKCFAETRNHKNKLTMIAEPLEKGLAEEIEGKAVTLSMPRKSIESFFQTKYEWDLLAARSVWAFGPTANGANVLLNDTLPNEVDKTLLSGVRDSIVQGFQWSTRQGPLCDEPIRNAKFRLVHAAIAQEAFQRGSGQIIPTSRRVAYSAFLMATPRLLEPVYYSEIAAPLDCINAIYTVLGRRRGHVLADIPSPGSPLYRIKALVPVMDSFGFETDIRAHTQGQAFCQSVFDHWAIVPGDPLDKTIVLRPLEPSPAAALARDFMIKTRRRKGMSEDVSINKYFDDPMLLELAKQDVDFL